MPALTVAQFARQSGETAAHSVISLMRHIALVDIGCDETLPIVARGEIRDSQTVALSFYARARG
jgi:hypothetical protein